MAKVFIDGEHGTTGLQIRARLAARLDLEIISLAHEHRKDNTARADYLNASDIAILCLPDDAARASVAMISNPNTVVIDASTAHRTSSGWVYGFPEMDHAQVTRIACSKRISNPGCWPQGPIALIRPLIAAGLLSSDFQVTMSGVSGYSGGGRQMIEDYENQEQPCFLPYALNLNHKHVAELQTNALLSTVPLMQPAVGNFAQGMITMVPLTLEKCEKKPTGAQIHEALSDHYAAISNSMVKVAPFEQSDRNRAINPQIHNDTDVMTLYVHANDARAQVLLIAVYDNLGKGASGAMMQNLQCVLQR